MATTHTASRPPRAIQLPNPWQYASGYLDPTGLVKFGTRYYDPNLARWTQQDPIAGDISSTAAINQYTYAWDDPINLTDLGGCQIQVRIVFQRIGICAEANVSRA